MTNLETSTDPLAQTGVLFGLKPANKSALLAELAKGAAQAAGLPADAIAAALAAREALGSTGIGKGVAVPHARMDGLNRVVCLLALLSKPVAYEAVDGKPVDLLFVLLSPADANAQYLATLAAATRRMRRAETLASVRAANNGQAALAAFLAAE